MLGHRLNWYWKIMLAGVSPILLIALFIFYIVNYIQGGTPTYQAWNKELVRPLYLQYLINTPVITLTSTRPKKLVR